MAYDAQTSGGLLAAVPAARLEEVLRDLEAAGVSEAQRIGEVLEGSAGRIVLTP